jgi:predicted RND superfamily exporter protein
MTRLIDQVSRDGWRCFAASSMLVWLLLVVSGGSALRATIALAINLLPALLVIAGLGWLGSKINMGSAMIAAVSIGLSIDGSVHFLSSYRRKLKRGHDPKSSAIHAAGNVGAAVVLATLALVIGFGGLVTSEFVPTSTFGLLVAITLVVGAIVNLTLLPCLVAITARR